MICNNISSCHEPVHIGEDQNALRVLCTHCKTQFVIRKDPFKGVPEKRQYIEIFRKESLQGGQNLFYKYYPQFMTQ